MHASERDHKDPKKTAGQLEAADRYELLYRQERAQRIALQFAVLQEEQKKAGDEQKACHDRVTADYALGPSDPVNLLSGEITRSPMKLVPADDSEAAG